MYSNKVHNYFDNYDYYGIYALLQDDIVVLIDTSSNILSNEQYPLNIYIPNIKQISYKDRTSKPNPLSIQSFKSTITNTMSFQPSNSTSLTPTNAFVPTMTNRMTIPQRLDISLYERLRMNITLSHQTANVGDTITMTFTIYSPRTSLEAASMDLNIPSYLKPVCVLTSQNYKQCSIGVTSDYNSVVVLPISTNTTNVTFANAPNTRKRPIGLSKFGTVDFIVQPNAEGQVIRIKGKLIGLTSNEGYSVCDRNAKCNNKNKNNTMFDGNTDDVYFNYNINTPDKNNTGTITINGTSTNTNTNIGPSPALVTLKNDILAYIKALPKKHPNTHLTRLKPAFNYLLYQSPGQVKDSVDLMKQVKKTYGESAYSNQYDANKNAIRSNKQVQSELDKLIQRYNNIL